MHLVMLQGEKFEKNIHTKVMVLVHNMSSECVLQMYEDSLKFLKWYQNIERTRKSIANDQKEIAPIYP